MVLALALVVPCYNEAKRFDESQFTEFLKKNCDVRIAFVNDGSTDATSDIIGAFSDRYPSQVEIINLPVNSGKAEAVRIGLVHCLDRYQPDLVGYWDADLSTPLNEISRFISVFNRDSEVEAVFGSRVKLLGRTIERRAIRHYLGRVFATAASRVLSLAVYDTQCGAKIFRVTHRLGKALSDPFISSWIFDVELIARMGSESYRSIYELPLNTWVEIGGSKVKPQDFFIAFIQLMRIFMRYRLTTFGQRRRRVSA